MIITLDTKTKETTINCASIKEIKDYFEYPANHFNKSDYNLVSINGAIFLQEKLDSDAEQLNEH